MPVHYNKDGDSNLSCYLIGEDHLVIDCAEILLAQEYLVLGIISPNLAVKEWAIERNIAYFDAIGSAETTLLNTAFDYLFSIVNSKILSSAIINSPRQFTINYHNALLPRYAGLNANCWAIINNEKMHGVTWHVMAETVDTGDILKQASFAIDNHETALSLNLKCYKQAVITFLQLAHELATSSYHRIPQDLTQRTYYSGKNRTKGNAWVDWCLPAEDIDRLYRALNWGQYVNLLGLPKFIIADQVFIIDKLEVLAKNSARQPGTLLKIETDGLHIATATADIVLTKVSSLKGDVWDIKALCQQFNLAVGECLPLPNPNLHQQLQQISSDNFKNEAFWVRELAKFQPAQLPFLTPLTAEQNTSKSEYQCSFKIAIPDIKYQALLAAFPDMMQPANILLTIWLIYLYRLGNESSIGVAFSYKELTTLPAELVPFIANSVPFSIQLNDTMDFNQALAIVNQQCITLEKRGTYARDIIRCYPNLSADANKALMQILLTDSALKDNHCTAPIVFVIALDGKTGQLWIDKSVINAEPDLQAIIENIPGHLAQLLDAISTNQQQTIAQLELLTLAERQQILIDWNQTQTLYPADKTIHQLFEQQVAQTPQNIALTYYKEKLSYAKLNQQANQLAHYLQKLRVKPGQRVAICMERSIETIISMLGILKLGAVYVPVDPRYPSQHLQFIFSDISAHVILTKHALKEQIINSIESQKDSINIIALDDVSSVLSQQLKSNLPPVSLQSDDPAHIIYTSGSTGQPKGVIVPHRAVIRLVKNTNFFVVTEQDSIAHVSNISFDAATCEIWGALLNGARLVCADNNTLLNPNKFADFLQVEAIDTLLITTGLFNQYVSQYPAMFKHLRYLIVCGEVLPPDRIALLQNCAAGYPSYILNGYGPTENAACTTKFIISHQSKLRDNIPIGKPISNTTVYVLDNHLKPLPIGASGELYTGGDGLALGYLNKPELTQDRFIQNPFSSDPKSKLYKTGDRVRWLPDGNLEYLGRLDNQVKIRGFRIELGSIQTHLLQYPDISQALITVYQNQASHKHLIAYVVANNNVTLDTAAIRQFLSDRLPAYMIPSLFISLAQLPLNTNGKVDTKSLPMPNLNRCFLAKNYSEPKSSIEKKLAAIWANLLAIELVGIHDNFFELGGHSLLITRLILEIQQHFSINIVLHDFLEQPTIAHLASLLTKDDTLSKIHPITEIKKMPALDDVQLDPSIQPIFPLNSVVHPPTAILLTGITGFLGIHLLCDLYRYTAAKLYCLVRADSVDEAMDKIKTSLARYQLTLPCMERIVPVLGDLAKPQLGLSQVQFDLLATDIDSIYHAGAYVHHLYNYETLRAANVYGTVELLKLATTWRTKPLHYISSLSAVIDYQDKQGFIIEDFMALESPWNPSLNGYGQSKRVCELLLAQAYQRGIPVKIYRPGWIMGPSDRFVGSADNNHLYLLMMGCLQMGCAPDWDMQLNMLPVNFVSQAIAKISLNLAISAPVFNLANSITINWRTLINFIRAHHPDNLQIVPAIEWRTQYLPKINKNNSLFSLLSLYLDNTDTDYMDMQNQLTRVNILHTQQALAELGIEYPIATPEEVLNDYFKLVYKEVNYASETCEF